MSFVDTFRKLGPPWLVDNEVGESLATMLDTFAARARAALTARFPAYAPDAAALAALGRDRRIVRGIGEPAAAYAARLSRAFTDLQTRGNPYSLMEQIRAFLQVDCKLRTFDANGNVYTLDTDGTRSASIPGVGAGILTWPVTGSEQWSQFCVAIFPTADESSTVAEPWASSASGATRTTIGTTATENEVAGIRSIIREWKPAGTVCQWIVVAYDAASFDEASDPAKIPDYTYRNWSTITSGVRVPSRLSTARYFSGANR